ncbi:MAG: hypothetical protein EBY22_17800, partial [Gammaproteobacteria bacterium]|nr:hypothetical protein [Gammaproteobacteria bacterium]
PARHPHDTRTTPTPFAVRFHLAVGFGGWWIAPHEWQWPKAPTVYCLHIAQRHHGIGGLSAMPNSLLGPGPVSVGAGCTHIL